jgi:hypothetical protein
MIFAGETVKIPGGSSAAQGSTAAQNSTAQSSTAQASTGQASTGQASTGQASTEQASSEQASGSQSTGSSYRSPSSIAGTATRSSSTGSSSSSSGNSTSSLSDIPGVPSSFASCVAYRESTNLQNPAANGNAYGIIPASGYNVSGGSLASQKQVFAKLYQQYGTSPWASDGC